MGIRRGRIELFHDDQLVVALPDLKIIASTLERFGVAPGPVDERPVLGLALIRGLANVDTAVSELLNGGAGGIGQELARYRDERAAALAAAPGAEVAGLDLLIRANHLTFARDYPGWRVAIGKNYRPSPVKGYPHLGGGEGDPQPVDADLGTAILAGCPDLTLGSGVRVGLLDTRMYPDPWLTGHYLARPGDLLDRNQDSFTVFDGHCAFVASCIVREAPAAEIHVRRVLDSQGDDTAWDAGVAMAETARTPVDVVNLSFGEFFTDDNTAPMIFEAAVKRFSPETVLVAAAGNNGDVEHLPPGLVPDGLKPNSASYPAALVDVVGRRCARSQRQPRRVHPASRSLDIPAGARRRADRGLRAGRGEHPAQGQDRPRPGLEAGHLPRDGRLGGVLLRGGRRQWRHRGRHRAGAPVRPPGAGGTAQPRSGPARLRHPAQRSGPDARHCRGT